MIQFPVLSPYHHDLALINVQEVLLVYMVTVLIMILSITFPSEKLSVFHQIRAHLMGISVYTSDTPAFFKWMIAGDTVLLHSNRSKIQTAP